MATGFVRGGHRTPCELIQKYDRNGLIPKQTFRPFIYCTFFVQIANNLLVLIFCKIYFSTFSMFDFLEISIPPTIIQNSHRISLLAASVCAKHPYFTYFLPLLDNRRNCTKLLSMNIILRLPRFFTHRLGNRCIPRLPTTRASRVASHQTQRSDLRDL